MKVPILDMKSVKIRKGKNYVGAAKSSRSWARQTVKDRLQAVSNGCAHSENGTMKMGVFYTYQ